METTNRGFPVLSFVEADGAACSIQDSSLAERDCIWLGRDGKDAVRMHLTTDMAADLIDLLEGGGVGETVFDDFYGSRCVIAQEDGDQGCIRLGTTMDFEGNIQRPMRISPELLDILLPLISTFVETGSIRE